MFDCVGEFTTGIMNQKFVAPQVTEKGSSPKRGIKVLGLFSLKLLLIQKEGVLNILYINRSL